MARLNEILVGRYNRALQKTFGIKGGPPVATLAPEIMPVTHVRSGVEDEYPNSWNKFAFGRSIGASAGQSVEWMINLAFSAGTLAVVESILVSAAAAAEFEISVSTGGSQGNLASTGPSINLDGRYGNQTSGTVKGSFQTTTASSFSQIADILLGASFPWEFISTPEQEIPMAFGQTGINSVIQVKLITQNVAATCFFRWRERLCEDSERT